MNMYGTSNGYEFDQRKTLIVGRTRCMLVYSDLRTDYCSYALSCNFHVKDFAVHRAI